MYASCILVDASLACGQLILTGRQLLMALPSMCMNRFSVLPGKLPVTYILA